MKDTTIRSILEEYIRKENMNMLSFSLAAGMNRGTLSAILNGNPPKPIAISQLDLITIGMQLPVGALYDLYVDECFITKAPHWRRLRPFLLRCAEYEKYECMTNVVQRLAEDLSYMPGIFSTAEMIHKQGRTKAAALLYKCVAEGEKYQHSERLAICQYRLFNEKVGQDMVANFKAATQFDPFIDRLPEYEQLDALRDLGNIYTGLHEWERLDEIADQLERLVKTLYKYECESNRYDEINRKTKYPLVAYYGNAYLMKAEVCDNFRDYERAKAYNNRYADLSWFRGLGHEGKACVIQFSEWSRANAYVFDLKSGKVDILPEYVSYIEDKEYEILPGLEIIMKAANQYDLDIDPILSQFKDRISTYFHRDFTIGNYNRQLSMHRYVNFFYEVSYYNFKKTSYDIAYKYIIASLEISLEMNNKSVLLKCIALFEKFRHTASEESIHEYKNIMARVHDIAQNDILFVGPHS
ncbi:transcriptional regulator with XRE-family HTH domain [Paenibacillus sp. DS2015]|uniref:transcriptional regulator n=1 Tax=Paenibacillus sp. DS2015 TaxID=3373917 RepID=UPI003D19AFB9